MSYQFSIIIPIRPHLKKMIARTKTTNPFTLSMGKCYYSQIIFSNLLKGYIQVKPKDEFRFTEKMEVQIPNEMAKENRFTWDSKTITSIDKALSGIFEDKLFTYLNDNCEGKGDIKDYILKFMENYNLADEDIMLDSLKKMFYRYRKATDKFNKTNFRAGSDNQQSVDNTVENNPTLF